MHDIGSALDSAIGLLAILIFVVVMGYAFLVDLPAYARYVREVQRETARELEALEGADRRSRVNHEAR